jgi:hypothetical protein
MLEKQAKTMTDLDLRDGVDHEIATARSIVSAIMNLTAESDDMPSAIGLPLENYEWITMDLDEHLERGQAYIYELAKRQCKESEKNNVSVLKA